MVNGLKINEDDFKKQEPEDRDLIIYRNVCHLVEKICNLPCNEHRWFKWQFRLLWGIVLVLIAGVIGIKVL